jgi:hypothetical protein
MVDEVSVCLVCNSYMGDSYDISSSVRLSRHAASLLRGYEGQLQFNPDFAAQVGPACKCRGTKSVYTQEEGVKTECYLGTNLEQNTTLNNFVAQRT